MKMISGWRAVGKFLAFSFFLFSTCAFCPADLRAQTAGHPDRPPTATATSSPQISEGARILFESVNRERASRGLPALHWDAHLAIPAGIHAQRMAEADDLSHQLPGEPELLTRLSEAGAKFTSIAENIAEGPDPEAIHDGWMHSPGHRSNILDPKITAVGIAVVQGRKQLFAVQDFARAVQPLDPAEQEREVSALLAARGLKVDSKSVDARKNCDANVGVSGVTAMSLIRLEAGDLTSLPESVAKKVESHSFQRAAVGACPVTGKSGFVNYRIVILLY